jgi:hypothetical protein
MISALANENLSADTIFGSSHSFALLLKRRENFVAKFDTFCRAKLCDQSKKNKQLRNRSPFNTIFYRPIVPFEAQRFDVLGLPFFLPFFTKE